jgi:hypothetical protein
MSPPVPDYRLCQHQSTAAPIADRSRRAYRIGAGPSQSEPKSLYKLAKPINSFRFLSRVLDSRPKWGWQRLLSLYPGSFSPSQP